MNASRLYSNSPNRSNSAHKLHLNCQSKIDDSNPDTKEWLALEEKFDHSSSDYHIYRGLLEKKTPIVAKISRAGTNLKRDYEIGLELNSALRLPTLLDYYCMFECLESMRDFTPSKHSLCKKTGDPIHVIIMPYINGKQINNWEWVRGNFETLKNVMKHIVLTALYAARTIGFVHKDLHLGNIMVKRTQRKEVTYGEWGTFPLDGVQPVIMDYDKAFINKEGAFWVYDDIRNTFSLFTNNLNTRLRTDKIMNEAGKMFKEQRSITEAVVKTLLNAIDAIEITYVASEISPVRFAF